MTLSSDIQQALCASFGDTDVKCIPMLLIDDSSNFKGSDSDCTADIAIHFYQSNGFIADRSRRDQYGYAAILRDLANVPPWINDWAEDIEAEQGADFRHFIFHAIENSDDLLLEKFRSYYDEMSAAVVTAIHPHVFDMLKNFNQKDFLNRVALA